MLKKLWVIEDVKSNAGRINNRVNNLRFMPCLQKNLQARWPSMV